MTKDRRVGDRGRGEQRRDRLHADLLVLAQPHRAQFAALRYFALDGTDHRNHRAQASMIRRYIIWRNQHARDQLLRQTVNRANVPDAALGVIDALSTAGLMLLQAHLLSFESPTTALR
jgi:hypothetical protein